MGWIIFACITALLLLLLFTWVRFVFVYNNELTLILRIGVFRKTIYPVKRKIKPEKYSTKKLERMERKQAEKERRKSERKEKKNRKKAAEDTKKSEVSNKQSTVEKTVSMIKLVRRLIFVVFGKFFKHLRIDIARLKIKVATGDAADTAIAYGTISAAVSCLCELLSNITNLKTDKNTDIEVIPDFIGDQFSVDLYISLRIRIWHVISIAFSAAMSFIKEKIK